MTSLPHEEQVPLDGALSSDALSALGKRPIGVYVHVPWCSSRCGYCDFNTYVPERMSDATPRQFVDDALAEVSLTRDLLGDSLDRPIDTVFFGGGTPTLLPAHELGQVLAEIASAFGLAEGAEITTEANPETLSPEYLEELRAAGFNRLSLGMQSASPDVLATLDRSHTPGRAVSAVAWAKEAGFDEVSLDLIYGSPGETLEQWQSTVEVALESEPTHISAYSLIVEPGTAMARKVARGELTPTGEDAMAEFHEYADVQFHEAGLNWYEVSNWSRPGSECRHNLGYWRSDNWLGFGPGAHGHINGVRWWNIKHPATYSSKLRNGDLPTAGWESLDDKSRELEVLMMGLRVCEGVALDDVPSVPRIEIEELVRSGLLSLSVGSDPRISVTENGKLLADLLVRRLATKSGLI